MSEAPVPTRLLRDVLWRRLDETSLEHCRLSELPSGYALQGVVLALANARPFQVHYVVHCDADWATRQVHVRTVHGESFRRLRLRRDDEGAWWRDEHRAHEFDGLVDIDLSITPATNTLPIRRLALAVGHAASTDAVWVRFPELTIEPLPQRYTRTGAGRYTYASRGGSFTADLEVDDEGLVVRYGRFWERVTAERQP